VNSLFKCKVCTEITQLKQILSTSNPTIFIKIVSISSQAYISQSDNYNSSQLLQYLTKASQWHPSSRSNSRCLTFESQPRNSSKNFFLHETLLNTTMRRMSPPKKSGAKETKSEIDEEDIFDDKLQWIHKQPRLQIELLLLPCAGGTNAFDGRFATSLGASLSPF